MNLIFRMVEENIGVSYENTILFIIIVGCIIFAAKDFKLSLIMGFLFSGSLFMWFYSQSLNYAPALTVMFLCLVLMAFSLYAVKTSVTQGGVI